MKLSRVFFFAIFFAGLSAGALYAGPFPEGTPGPFFPDDLPLEITQPPAGSDAEVLSGETASVSALLGLRANPPARVSVSVPSIGKNFCLPALFPPHDQWATANFRIAVPSNYGSSITPDSSVGGCFTVTMPNGALTSDHIIYAVEIEDRPRRYGIIDLIKEGAY